MRKLVSCCYPVAFTGLAVLVSCVPRATTPPTGGGDTAGNLADRVFVTADAVRTDGAQVDSTPRDGSATADAAVRPDGRSRGDAAVADRFVTDRSVADAAVPDAGSLSDAATADSASPECTLDQHCSGQRECYAGVCRDTCNYWCLYQPSGDQCHEGYCVECTTDAHCQERGTRLFCNQQDYTCYVGPPMDTSQTKIGIFYHTWHCLASDAVYDISEILAGNQDWGPMHAFHYWDQPEQGYYCLTQDTHVLRRHAELLRDAGIDFVFLDVTNHPYRDHRCAHTTSMITQPVDKMLEIWSTINGAPKLVPWVPVSADSTDANVNTVDHLLARLGAYPGMHFEYLGKPLLLVTENDVHPMSQSKVAQLEQNYTVRVMWAFEDPGSRWSFLEDCENDPAGEAPCLQRLATRNGTVEQVSTTATYQGDFMSNTRTAQPKLHGRTFRKQWETVLHNPTAPIVTITGWNEWIAQRQPCGDSPCECDVYPWGCFIDAWATEYNRDFEPVNNPTGDYYYRLLVDCIALFRSGDYCDAANANRLCCSDDAT